MNFLAHAHLSGDNDALLFGNFVADSVKGNELNRYHQEVKNGIVLHRKIDRFTDMHPVVSGSKDKIRRHFGLYSGIVVDIFYDHFLAANWNLFSPVELSEFSTNVYKILAKRFLLLPPRTLRILPFLIAQNWLSSYANLTDLKRVFYGMDRRTRFRSGMSGAVEVLQQNYKSLEKDFFLFYPELIKYVNKQPEKSL